MVLIDIKTVVLLHIFGFGGKYLFQVLKYLMFAVNCMIIHRFGIRGLVQELLGFFGT